MSDVFIPHRLSQRPPLRGADVVRWLDTPIPAVATTGTLVLKASTFGTYSTKIYKDDKIVITTSGVAYTYYATADVDFRLYSQTISIPVLPLIQAAHLEYDLVRIPAGLYGQRVGETVIGPMLPASVGSYRDYADALYDDEAALGGVCLPYVRAWPSANDPTGIPWGQSDLLALSFYPLNVEPHRQADDEYKVQDLYDATSGLTYQQWTHSDLIPVPKVIAAGYTKRTRRDGARYRVRGAYENSEFFNVRTATGNHYRPGTLSAWRYDWQPRAQVFTNRLAATNPFGGAGVNLNYVPATGHVDLAASVNNGGAWHGSRGGRYSISGYAQDIAGGGATSGFSLEVWTTDPGYADVKLLTIAVPDGSGFGVRVTGTWTATVLPTGVGECGQLYCRAYPGATADNIILFARTLGECISIYGTGNVPWCHSIATGNLVAPGGLVAPFY